MATEGADRLRWPGGWRGRARIAFAPLAVLRRRDFALLWTAGLVSLAGDKVLGIALPFYVYSATGSALATGAMFLAQALPRLLLGAPAGVFVDRWDRRRVMVAADVLRGALLFALLAVRSVELLWIVYLVAFAESSVSQFAGPARSALVPRLVPERELVAANSLGAQASAITSLIGPTLGGALMALLGLPSVVLVDATSYFASAVLNALIAVPPGPERADAAHEKAAPTSPRLPPRPDELPCSPSRPGREPVAASASAAWLRVWREWLAGLRLVRNDRQVGALFTVMGIVMLAQGLLDVLWVPFVRDALGGGAMELGWLSAAGGVGILVGGFAVGHASRLTGPARLVGLGGLFGGAIMVVRDHVPLLPAALALNLALYVPVVALIVCHQTLLQRGVADRYRGRVFGALITTNALLMLAGLGAASFLAESVGIVPLLDCAGALWLAAGAIGLATLGNLPRRSGDHTVGQVAGADTDADLR